MKKATQLIRDATKRATKEINAEPEPAPVGQVAWRVEVKADCVLLDRH